MQEHSLSAVSMSLSLSLTFLSKKLCQCTRALNVRTLEPTLTCGKVAYLDLLHETNTLAYYAMAK